MSQFNKLKERFLSEPSNFQWRELIKLLITLGYKEHQAGKTSGSRVRFIHIDHEPILLHKPHPKPVLKRYQIKQLVNTLKKQRPAMKDMMKYKDYYGSVHFDADEPIFYGQIEFIKALVSYEAKDAVGIKKAFEEAVDDYLALCKKQNKEPEKPFKGSFNVRIGQELHEKVALAAQREKMSINKFICHLLYYVLNNEAQPLRLKNKRSIS